MQVRIRNWAGNFFNECRQPWPAARTEQQHWFVEIEPPARRFLSDTGLQGENILPPSELLKEIGGDASEERKREMKALFDGQAALKEHSGIAE
jgi:hypothetical protein